LGFGIKGHILKKIYCAAAFLAITVATAFAADLPVKAPPIQPQVYSWTGFYAGMNGGYGWGDPSHGVAADNDAANLFIRTHGVPNGTVDVSGAVAGGQIGYNWQVRPNWLAGVEADLNWANMRGSSSTIGSAAFGDSINHTFTNGLDWFGTVRGRIGFLPTQNLLMYATGGLAYGRTHVSEATTNLTFTGVYFQGVHPDGSTLFCIGGNCVSGSGSQTSVGWTAGGGLEYAIWKNITVKAEYLYMDLGYQTIHPSSQSFNGSTPSSIAVTFHDAYNIVRAGINFRF
jgi:outer membrane immunogenic protein